MEVSLQASGPMEWRQCMCVSYIGTRGGQDDAGSHAPSNVCSSTPQANPPSSGHTAIISDAHHQVTHAEERRKPPPVGARFVRARPNESAVPRATRAQPLAGGHEHS